MQGGTGGASWAIRLRRRGNLSLMSKLSSAPAREAQAGASTLSSSFARRYEFVSVQVAFESSLTSLIDDQEDPSL